MQVFVGTPQRAKFSCEWRDIADNLLSRAGPTVDHDTARRALLSNSQEMEHVMGLFHVFHLQDSTNVRCPPEIPSVDTNSGIAGNQ